MITIDQKELTVDLNATDNDFLKGVKAIDANDGDVTSSVVVEMCIKLLKRRAPSCRSGSSG